MLRIDLPMRRCISCVRPLCLPRAASRSPRVWVALGSMPYSAVTQPSPLPFWCGGTFSRMLAVQSTCVSPNLTKTEPSACLVNPRIMLISRRFSALLLLGLLKFVMLRLYNMRMIESMTGFGGASRQIHLGGKVYATVAVECRSVNSRFLDLNIRSPEECRSAEMPIREMVTKQLSRGKVEFRINVHREAGEGLVTADLLNQGALEGLKALEAAVLKEMPGAGNMRMGEILKWPGVANCHLGGC